ncbi:hypothetical protein PIB30_023526 [Stylosanthes scabra]|uniref:Uncharacterized protein n=1 Tax=Stylosanthes scabra TaxID=79078 RepID=A0ABU6U8K0_9FABA|nr:hypothetical protein [Stylosanthes scabra]
MFSLFPKFNEANVLTSYFATPTANLDPEILDLLRSSSIGKISTLSDLQPPLTTTAEPHLFPFFFSLLYLFLTHVSSAPAPYRPPSICVIALQIRAYKNNDVAPLTLSASLFSTASPASAISPVGAIENHRAFHLSSPPWLVICWLNCALLYLSQPLPLLRTVAPPCSSVLHYSSNHCPLSPRMEQEKAEW